MRISYDAEVDALSIIFREATVTTAELAEGIAAEYDADGRLVGLEVLDAARRFGDAAVLGEVVLEGVGPAPAAPGAAAPGSDVQRAFDESWRRNELGYRSLADR